MSTATTDAARIAWPEQSGPAGIERQAYDAAGLARALGGIGTVEPADPETFRYEQTSVIVGSYSIRRIAFTAATYTQRVFPSSTAELHFTYVLDGSLEIAQAGRSITLNAGDSAITIGWAAFRLTTTAPVTMLRVQTSRAVVESHGIAFPHSVRLIRPSEPLGRSLAAFLTETLRSDMHPLPVADTLRIVQMLDVLMVEIHLTQSSRTFDTNRRRDELRRRAYAFMDAADRPALTVDAVAAHLGISVRGAQRLFEDEETTLGREIAERRRRREVPA